MKTEKTDLDGQMNLFEVLNDDETNEIDVDEPEAKKEPEAEEQKEDYYPIHRKAKDMAVVMHKVFSDILDHEKVVLAYLDYNVVYYKPAKEEAKALQFQTAKLAVDYYINLIDELRNNEMLIEEEGDFQLEDV